MMNALNERPGRPGPSRIRVTSVASGRNAARLTGSGAFQPVTASRRSSTAPGVRGILTNSSARPACRSRSAAGSRGVEPSLARVLPDVPELRDEHREVPSTVDPPGPAHFAIGLIEGPGAFGVPEAELEQHERQLLARIRQPAVLPIDDTESAGRRPKDVVGPQIAMAGLQISGALHESLERSRGRRASLPDGRRTAHRAPGGCRSADPTGRPRRVPCTRDPWGVVRGIAGGASRRRCFRPRRDPRPCHVRAGRPIRRP